MSGFVDPPLGAVRDVVARALAEDLLPLGDVTATLVDPAARAHVALVSRAPGVLAGRLGAAETFGQVDPSLEVAWLLDDGEGLGAGAVIATVVGSLTSILTAERTALNLLCHLSGVATLTRRYVAAVAGSGARILDTRKTTPGLRALEKAAVRAGGGHNHRGNLSEMVLVKDNHLGGTSIAEAVARARELWPMRTVEVECDGLGQVREALEAGSDCVLLDNMTPDDVAVAVQEVGGRAVVEVSGGLSLDNVAAFAAAGADLLSVGALTHSAPALDIGLDLGA
ncbi:MAG: carboxylating nicotinate-nucleotide diphosphorylase [Actinomycetota bacterium]|nr:carboxylating nicotinate-nucleotide diphosphorylase [Actinomycetota bacterium]